MAKDIGPRISPASKSSAFSSLCYCCRISSFLKIQCCFHASLPHSPFCDVPECSISISICVWSLFLSNFSSIPTVHMSLVFNWAVSLHIFDVLNVLMSSILQRVLIDNIIKNWFVHPLLKTYIWRQHNCLEIVLYESATFTGKLVSLSMWQLPQLVCYKTICLVGRLEPSHKNTYVHSFAWGQLWAICPVTRL